MDGLVRKIEYHIERGRAVAPGDRVLAAVSGGLDSMCLLSLLARLRGALDFELAAAHFDHGLRGDDGRRERDMVERVCRELAVEFTAGTTSEIAAEVERGANLQEVARRRRYGFLWDAADRLGCNRLATGHHRDDQAETVLLRLIQGSGMIGLAGMAPVSRDGRLVRPLLDVPRGELERYAADNGLRWLEDPTNATNKYRRNRLRHQLIPRVERRRDRRFSENLASLAAEAAELTALLDGLVDRFIRDGAVAIDEGRAQIDCGRLERPAGLVRRHVLRRAAERASGGDLLLSGRLLAAVDSLAVEGVSGSSLDLPGEYMARREFDRLTVSRSSKEGTAAGGQSIVLRLDRPNILNPGGTRWTIDSVVEFCAAGEALRFLPEEGEVGAVAATQPFDLDRLELPLTAGGWTAGDRMRQYGGREKKLKKLFAERRVPAFSRGDLPVVRDGRGRVLWAPTVARSDLAPLDGATRRVLLLTASRVDTVPGERAGRC